jgi:hypothetical protein
MFDFQASRSPTCPAGKVASPCDCIKAAQLEQISDVYECYTDSDCQCEVGYYGNKASQCTKCKICDANAALANPCVAGGVTDTVTCTCNSGYFGSGINCYPIATSAAPTTKITEGNALLYNFCNATKNMTLRTLNTTLTTIANCCYQRRYNDKWRNTHYFYPTSC